MTNANNNSSGNHLACHRLGSEGQHAYRAAPSNFWHLAIAIFLSVVTVITQPVSGQSPESPALPRTETPDDLAPSATWKPATSKKIVGEFRKWLSDSEIDKQTTGDVNEFLKKLDANNSDSSPKSELIDDIVEALAIARPDINRVREALRLQRQGTRPPDFSSLLDNPEEKDFLRNHIRLYYGRWLAQNEFYDESLAQLERLDVAKILDRPSLLFYRALMEHQLLKKEECLKTLSTLLENADSLPRRYDVLSKLMLADIKPLETDSLDEISRMMNDIRRRTDLSRSGKTVLKKEEEVIKKLDKLIEELESQQKSRAVTSSVAPSSPMQDSWKAGGKGSGEVTSKQQIDGGDWGDLPPADRAAALAEMAKDMPPHYRAVVEEYFKRLAKENE